MKLLILCSLFISFSFIFAQEEPDIVPYLIKIEQGNADDVKNELPQLNRKYPGSPSILYLQALLTADADSAVKLYKRIIDIHPRSKYADASIYRLYSYYSAMEDKELSAEYESQLLVKYPSSPYTKLLRPVIKEPVQETGEYQFSVQAGAFANSQNAENLRKKFIRAGYYADVRQKNIGGSVFNVVYAGRFKNRKEAENFQAVLNKEYGLKGIITRYQQ